MSALAPHEAALRALEYGFRHQAGVYPALAPILTAMANAHGMAANRLRAQIMAGVQDSTDGRQ